MIPIYKSGFLLKGVLCSKYGNEGNEGNNDKKWKKIKKNIVKCVSEKRELGSLSIERYI